MKKLLLLPALPFLLIVGEVIASLFYCALTNRLALFTYPYLQWWDVLSYWSTNWLMPILIVLSGIAGLMPLVFAAGLLFRRRSKQTRSLYGQQTWADDEALRNGGIQLKRRQ